MTIIVRFGEKKLSFMFKLCCKEK